MAEVIRRAIESRLVDVHTALPATVVSYDETKQTATVRPGVQRAIQNASDGSKILEDLPTIQDVPVAWPRGGGGGWFLTMPLAAWDTGLLIFCERDIGMWRATGEYRAVDPGDQRTHGLSGAVFLPGLKLASKAISGLPANEAVLAGAVRLGAKDATDYVSLASLVTLELAKINVAITAAIAAVLAGDGGAAAFAAMQSSLSGASFPTSTAATLVKAK